LVCGLSHSSTPGQRAAVELAERIGAVIDTTASVCHGPSIVAIQNAGESTCSLGEVRQRADLVLFWGGDPAVTHPRHFERYSVEPASEFLPNGRDDRHVVVVDSTATATSRIADEFVQVAPERDFELIAALRMLVRNPDAKFDVECGAPWDAIARLAERMRTCRYGIVFFGLGLAQSPQGHLTVEALLRLVAELNAVTRFTARRLRIPGDVSGADSVLCWQTGFPFGVDLSRGYPRYNPGEFTANELLERGDVDCVLVIGSESLPAFSDRARNVLAGLPTIVLDPAHVHADFSPTVQFTTAVYGVHAPGTVYRMDEIPIPVRSLCPTHSPTDEAVLKAICERLG
jgi:formylmethanofuran dehydrogenase subunit B